MPFEVFPDVVAELKLVVAPEGEELPPAEELAALEAQEVAEAAAAAAKPAEVEYLPESDDASQTPAEAAAAAEPEPPELPADETAAETDRGRTGRLSTVHRLSTGLGTTIHRLSTSGAAPVDFGRNFPQRPSVSSTTAIRTDVLYSLHRA